MIGVITAGLIFITENTILRWTRSEERDVIVCFLAETRADSYDAFRLLYINNFHFALLLAITLFFLQ